MKIAIYSDTHIHTWMRSGEDTSGLSVRTQHQIDVLDQIHQINIARKIDYNIFGGDGVHKPGEHPTAAFWVFDQFFKKNRVPTIAASGSHDSIDVVNPKEYQTFHTIIKSLSNAVSEIPGLKVKMVDFYSPVDYDAIKGYDIVVLHKQPAIINEYGHAVHGVDWQLLAKNNRTVWFGHDHTTKQLGPNAWVIGSIMHFNFGDSGERGIWILDTDTWKVEFVKLLYPEFRTVNQETEIPADDKYNYYRVLHPTKKDIDTDHVVAVQVPEVFDAKIHSDDFLGILKEWLVMNEKAEDYLKPIQCLIEARVDIVKKFFRGRIVDVTIKDFMSIGEVAYTIENGVTCITGHIEAKESKQTENEDTKESTSVDVVQVSSNGAGKTSMTGEAIEWLLFGETSKGLKGDDVIRRGSDEAIVTGRIVDREEAYLITRSTDKGLSIRKAGSDEDLVAGRRKPDRQKLFEETILGFSKETFMASCYFSQEHLQMLTGMTDGDKTSMVTNLLGFDEYDVMYEKVDDIRKGIADKIKELADYQSGIKNKRDAMDQRRTTLQESLARVETRLTEKTLLVRDTTDRKEKATIALGKMPVANRDFSEYDKKIKEIQTSLEETKLRLAEVSKALETSDKELAIEEKRKQAEALRIRINELSGANSRLAVSSSDLMLVPDVAAQLRDWDTRIEKAKTDQNNANADILKRKDALKAEQSGIKGELTRNKEILDMLKLERIPNDIMFTKYADIQKKIDELTANVHTVANEANQLATEINLMNKDVQTMKAGKMPEGVRCDSCGAVVTQANKEEYIREKESKIAEAMKNHTDKSESLKKDEETRSAYIRNAIAQMLTDYQTAIAGNNEAITKLDSAMQEADKGAEASAAALSQLIQGKDAYVKAAALAAIDSNKKAIAVAANDLAAISDVIEAAEKKKKELTEDKDLYEEKQRRQQDKVTTVLEEKNKAIEAARTCDERRKDLETSLSSCDERLKVYQAEIADANIEATQLRDSIKKVVADQSHLDEEDKHTAEDIESKVKITESLDFWKTAFSVTGIRTVLLDRFCNDFNFLANKALATISSGKMSVVVSPMKELKSGETRNKLGLRIRMGMAEVKYESLSGGEKRRVDMALCMALNHWVGQRYGVPHGLLGIIIFDEIFSFLDKLGEELVAGMLQEEAHDRAILIITHTGELASYADRVWVARKVEGLSCLDAGN